MGTKTKVCTKCGKRKPLSAFAKDCTKKDGVKSQCKECTNATAREARALLKEKQIKKKRLKESEEYFKRALNEAVAIRKDMAAKPAKGKKFDYDALLPKKEYKFKAIMKGQPTVDILLTEMIGEFIKTVADKFGFEASVIVKLKAKK